MWSECLRWWGIQWVAPKSINFLLNGWRVYSSRKLGAVIWNLMPLAILWSVWLQRNECKFNEAVVDWEWVSDRVKCRIASWTKSTNCSSSVSVDDMLFRLGSVKDVG